MFTVLGTIEPRKNHLLLLTLWRQMAEAGEAPQLLVIGKRGWMNDNIVALLDDCAAIQPFVTEANSLTDREIAAALSRSRAMLFPSFAEGLGIPVLEAKAAGLKVIASDLPALREIAADDTIFLNPLDVRAGAKRSCQPLFHKFRPLPPDQASAKRSRAEREQLKVVRGKHDRRILVVHPQPEKFDNVQDRIVEQQFADLGA